MKKERKTTPRDKKTSFIRLVEARMEKMMHDFHLIKNLANPYNYDFEMEQLSKIYFDLENQMAEVHSHFVQIHVFKYLRDANAKFKEMNENFMSDVPSFDSMIEAYRSNDPIEIVEATREIITELPTSVSDEAPIKVVEQKEASENVVKLISDDDEDIPTFLKTATR